MPRAWALVALWLIECVRGGLLLDEDFSCRAIGCNATHGITNYSYWRVSPLASLSFLIASVRWWPVPCGSLGTALRFSGSVVVLLK